MLFVLSFRFRFLPFIFFSRGGKVCLCYPQGTWAWYQGQKWSSSYTTSKWNSSSFLGFLSKSPSRLLIQSLIGKWTYNCTWYHGTPFQGLGNKPKHVTCSSLRWILLCYSPKSRKTKPLGRVEPIVFHWWGGGGRRERGGGTRGRRPSKNVYSKVL